MAASARIQRPDRDAVRLQLDDLFKEHSTYVARLAYRLMGRDVEIDDVVQDVFVLLLRHIDRIRQASAVRAWLATTTVRLTRRAEGGLQVVAWALRPDEATSSWWRWASPPVTTVGELQDNWLRTQQFQGGEPGQLRALSGLSSWQVYFYRSEWANCQSTGNVQPASPAISAPPGTDIPKGVRIVLSFAPGSGQNGSLTRDYLVAP